MTKVARAADLKVDDYIDAAYRSIDGLVRAQSVATQAAVMLKELPAPKVVASPLDTGEVSEEWLDQAINYETSLGEFRRRKQMLEGLRGQAKADAANLIEVNGDRILGSLGDMLELILNEARSAAAKLKGARTAGEAITNGSTAAWSELQALAEQHDSLRRSQQAVMTRSYPELIAPHLSHWSHEAPASNLYMSNLDELWPGSTNTSNGRPDPGANGRCEPWPADKVEQLIWAATSSARPWIPTPKDLDELGERRLEEAKLIAADRGNRHTPTVRAW